MAEKVIIEVDVEAGGAVDNLGKVDKEIKEIDQSVKKSEKGVKGFGKTLGNLGKAAGIIGLISAAFGILQEALQNNQKVMDTLSSVTTALGIAFNDLFNFLSNNVGTIVDYWSDIFSDPLGAIKELGNAFDQYIINVFNELIEAAGIAGDAISAFFDGDFAKAGELASKAFKESADVLTGIDGTVDKVTEGVNSLVDATTDYVTETYAAADAITQETKNLELLEAQQTRIREQSDRDAEIQRQIRDDETNSFKDRIAANEELGRILDEQQKKEQATVKERIATLEKEQVLLGFNEARRLEIYKLNTELAAIEAQQEGFRSEQLANRNALLRDQAALKQEAIDKEAEDAKAAIDLDNKNKAAKAKSDKKAAKEALELEEKVKAGKIQAASDVLSVVGTFAKEGSDLAKGVAIAQTTIDTFTGATAAFKSLAGIPLVGPALGAAAAAAAIAAGVANVKSITATNTDPKTASTGGGSISASTPQMPSLQSIEAPDFAINGDDGQSQLADTVDNANGTPVRAYIVADDVKNSAQFERQTQNGASFG